MRIRSLLSMLVFVCMLFALPNVYAQHSVQLSWTAPLPGTDTNALADYNCYRAGVTGGPYQLVLSVPVSVTSCTDTTVQAGLTYFYVVRAVDSVGTQSVNSNQVSATIPVATAPLSVAASILPLPQGTVGSAYNVKFLAAGGVAPYTYSISGLPSGLISSSGVVSGTPTASGTFQVTAKVTDSETTPVSVSTTLSLTVVTASTAVVSITPTSHSYGTLAVGVKSAPQAFVYKNGTSASITLTSGTMSGNSADFIYGGDNCPSVLAAGASCTLNWVFDPTATGTRAAVNAVTFTGATGSPVNINLSGTGGTISAIAVSISPTTPSVVAGKTQQFTATVSNSTNTAVTWSVNSGTISSTGLFTASPVVGQVTVKATSQADTSKFATAIVTITAAPSYVCSVTGTTTTSETLAVVISNFSKGQSVTVICPVTHP